MPLHVLVLAETWPEPIKAAPVLRELQRYEEFEMLSFASGQHRKVPRQAMQDVGSSLNAVAPQQSLAIPVAHHPRESQAAAARTAAIAHQRTRVRQKQRFVLSRGAPFSPPRSLTGRARFSLPAEASLFAPGRRLEAEIVVPTETRQLHRPLRRRACTDTGSPSDHPGTPRGVFRQGRLWLLQVFLRGQCLPALQNHG